MKVGIASTRDHAPVNFNESVRSFTHLMVFKTGTESMDPVASCNINSRYPTPAVTSLGLR
jgi:hypothetical protein